MTRLRICVRQACVLFSCLVLVLWLGLPAYAADSGDGMLLWGVQGSATSPWKQYTQSTDSWSSAADQSTDGYGVNLTNVIASPIENEMISISSNTNGQFRVHRYSGGSWSLEWTENGAGSDTSSVKPRFDGAYDVNGNALVVYSADSTTNEVAYRKFTASTNTWTSEQAIGSDRTDGILNSVRVENRPGTDEFAVAWSDDAAAMSANYYDFSADTWYGERSTVLSGALTGVVEPGDILGYDIAFEGQSGELLVCWADWNVQQRKCATRSAGIGGSWSGTTNTNTARYLYDMDMASDPNSDKIAWVSQASPTYLLASIWGGALFSSAQPVDTSVDDLDVGSHQVAAGWLTSDGTTRAVIMYDDSNAAGIDWAMHNGSFWIVQTDYTDAFAPAAVNDKFHKIIPNPLDQSQVAVLVVDGNDDIALKELTLSGTTFSWASLDNGTASHETNMRSRGGWAADFAYFASAGNSEPPVLTVDVVDGNGDAVASPSVSMSAVTSGNTCQTTTGTLGTSSQRVRVTNTTTTAAWSLTIAATGGSTALWTSGSDTYDFNDFTSSGCADGADADTKAGQLTITPTGGTISPESGCSSTGISWGGGGAFVEGTQNSLNLVSASGSADTGCYWDFTDTALSQEIPELIPAGSYSLQFTLTVAAS